MTTLTNLTVGSYSQVLQNGFLQVDFFFFFFRVLTFLTPYEIIFSLLPLQYCSNLLSISSANVLIFQWKNLILRNFSFNWQIAPAAATTSLNHASLWGASANIELFYEVTDALNLRCNFNGSHQSEYLLKMNSTTHFSPYPKASILSGKGLHHRHLHLKT